MGTVEAIMLDYIKHRLEGGALSVTEAEIMAGVVPADQPELRYRAAYRFGIERLLRRHLINSVYDRTGTRHYFIGNYASDALRKSLGI